MSEIPNKLQCAYCKRSRRHGGECSEKRDMHEESCCLIFLEDPKGCIRNQTGKIPFVLYQDIPAIGVWSTGWKLYDNDTEIKINRILGLSWNATSGLLYVHADFDYYVNEFNEKYKEAIEKNKGKKKFRLIK